jgi:hypothetical protein
VVPVEEEEENHEHDHSHPNRDSEDSLLNCTAEIAVELFVGEGTDSTLVEL